jgi:hypothetical protein
MLVTAAKPDGSVNSMTAAWGGVGFIWQQPVAYVFIRPQRCTKQFVESSQGFSLSFLNSSYRDALNFMGTVSGHDDANKVANSGLTLDWYDLDGVQGDGSATGGRPATGDSSKAGSGDPAAGGDAPPADSDGAPSAGGDNIERLLPYFSESGLVLFCQRLYQQDLRQECFLDIKPLESFYGRIDGELDLHTLYIANIRAVLADEEFSAA